MKKVAAFSPGHVTGLFRICDLQLDPLLNGSLGSGISITKGVKTRVIIEKSLKRSLIIKINGETVSSAQVSRRVIDSLLPHLDDNYMILVNHDFEIPIGAGLGSSGAGALSLALALNEALDLGLSRIETSQIAHVAEVECKTGLGTVIAETYGGLEVRVKPGAPGIGELTQIPIDENYVVVFLYIAPISTEKTLVNNELRHKINKFGDYYLNKLIMQPTPQKFMEFSRSFAEHIGLIPEKIKKIFSETDKAGYICSMAMFGESLFSLIERDNACTLLDILNEYASSEKDLIVSEIDFKGARII